MEEFIVGFIGGLQCVIMIAGMLCLVGMPYVVLVIFFDLPVIIGLVAMLVLSICMLGGFLNMK